MSSENSANLPLQTPEDSGDCVIVEENLTEKTENEKNKEKIEESDDDIVEVGCINKLEEIKKFNFRDEVVQEQPGYLENGNKTKIDENKEEVKSNSKNEEKVDKEYNSNSENKDKELPNSSNDEDSKDEPEQKEDSKDKHKGSKAKEKVSENVKVSEDEKDESEDEKDESEDEKDESEDESDDEQEKGLLDRPVEVTGCRARKQVQRFELPQSKKEVKKLVSEGKGQKLGACPRIELQISKHPATELKVLHRFLFGRLGSVSQLKKNIKQFSGFPFDKDSDQYLQKKNTMEKINAAELKKMCEILDLEVKGKKDDIIFRLLEFMLHPKESGKGLPKKKTGVKRKSKGKEKQTKSKKITESHEDDENLPSSDKSDEESDKGAKKKSKVETQKKTKVKPGKKSVTKSTTKRKHSGSSDEEEPPAKKSNIPSDKDIEKLIKNILKDADLQEITMKKVIKQIFETYPGVDLAHKKAYIKATIKSVIA